MSMKKDRLLGQLFGAQKVDQIKELLDLHLAPYRQLADGLRDMDLSGLRPEDKDWLAKLLFYIADTGLPGGAWRPTVGQQIIVLEPCSGEDNWGEEPTIPIGIPGKVYLIEQDRIHVTWPNGITNIFDQPEEYRLLLPYREDAYAP